MERLLEKGISKALELPESEQETIGTWLLAEREAERRWGELFNRSGSALERMADEVLEEREHGLTTPPDPDQL